MYIKLQLVERVLCAKRKQEEMANEVAILKQRVTYNRPPDYFSCFEISLPSSFHTINDAHVRSRLNERYRRMIQQSKANMLALLITIAEIQMHQAQKEFDRQMNELWHEYRSTEIDQHKSEVLITLIDQRLSNNYHAENAMYLQISSEFFRASSDGYQHEHVSRRSIIGFSSNLIINTSQSLPRRQLVTLGCGPAYVLPCQMRTQPSASLDNTLSKQFAPLHQQLNKLFSKAGVHLGRSMNFQSQVQTLFNSIFSTPLTRSTQQQASKEREVVRSIRQQLEKDELILRRTADGNNVFYLDRVDDFEQKAVRFILKTKAFKIIEIVDQARYDPKERQCVINVLDGINGTLESMMQKKRINSEQMSKMQTKKPCNEIPYLYFLPEISKVNIALLSLTANDEKCFSLA